MQQTQQQTASHFETSGAAPVVHQQQAPTSPHPVTATNSDGTFRQPLPPALARPRLPSQGSVVVRSPTGVRHPLQGLDPRLQVHLQHLHSLTNCCVIIQYTVRPWCNKNL